MTVVRYKDANLVRVSPRWMVYLTQFCGLLLHSATRERTRVGVDVGLAGGRSVGVGDGVGEGMIAAGNWKGVAGSEVRVMGCREGVGGSGEGVAVGTGTFAVASASI